MPRFRLLPPGLPSRKLAHAWPVLGHYTVVHPPTGRELSDCSGQFSSRCWPASATTPARSATSRAPAVRAAVSARKTWGPSVTWRETASSSASSHPPSGPTRTVGAASVIGAPPRTAKAMAKGPARAAGPVTSENVTGPSTTGSHARRLCIAACRATSRRRASRRPGAASSQRGTERAVVITTTRSTPASVNFCTAHSGWAPFVKENATVTTGCGRPSWAASPAASSSGDPVQQQGRTQPAPSEAETASPGRKRSTCERWWKSSWPTRTCPATTSSTNTCAAARPPRSPSRASPKAAARAT